MAAGGSFPWRVLLPQKLAKVFMFTYRATNTLNGKFYIGSTTNFEERKGAHLRSNEPYPFQRALRKNPDAFVWEVWSDGLDEPILEQTLLDWWFGSERCYNLNPSASHPPSPKGKKQSEEHKRRKADAIRGKKRSEEFCKKVSKAKKGKQPAWFLPDGTMPPEVVAKRAEARKRNGKKWTLEQREKMAKDRQLPEEEVERRVALITATEIDLNKWGAISKVAKLLGLTHPSARHFLNRYL